LKRILFVCLGNICRSPLAEGILRKKLSEAGLEIEVDSAGTISWHAGHPPDSRSVKTALDFGIDISQLRGRKFSNADFKRFDIILVMDKNNLSDVVSEAVSKNDIDKVKLMLDYSGLGNNDVPDPYYGEMKDFTDLYHLLDNACDKLIAKIKGQNQK
jgi:protein-tyrosine phosphatase